MGDNIGGGEERCRSSSDDEVIRGPADVGEVASCSGDDDSSCCCSSLSLSSLLCLVSILVSTSLCDDVDAVSVFFLISGDNDLVVAAVILLALVAVLAASSGAASLLSVLSVLVMLDMLMIGLRRVIYTDY